MQKNAVQRVTDPAIDDYEDKLLDLPHYLEKNYWWAYLHPKSMRFLNSSGW